MADGFFGSASDNIPTNSVTNNNLDPLPLANPTAEVQTITISNNTVTPTVSSPTVNTNTSNPQSGSSVDTTMQDNILGSYQQVAYHIRLYNKGDGVGSSASEITIAESGVTGFNIKDLHIDSIAAVNYKTRTTVNTKMQFTILEPMGTNFLDSLYSAVTQNSIKNYQKAPYYVELTFKGYNEDGTINSSICSNFANGGKWTYKIKLTTIDAHLEAAGSTYTISAIIYDEVALNVKYLRTTAPYSITGETVKEHFDNLSNALNSNCTANYGQDVIKYKFDFQQSSYAPSGKNDPSSFKISPPSQSDTINSQRGRAMSETDKKKPCTNIITGTSLIDHIQSILATTQEGGDLIRDAKGKITTESGDGLLGDGTYRSAGIFRIYPETTITGFDAASNSYAYLVTFHVKMFQAQGTTLKPEEANANKNSSAAIQGIQSYNGLKKRYEYIHTGLNTEVIEFDIKYNFVYDAVLPRLDGYFYYHEGTETHGHFSDQQKLDYANFKAGLAKLQSGTATITNITNPPAIVTNTNVQTSSNAYAEDLVPPITNPMIVSFQKANDSARQAAGTGVLAHSNPKRSIFGTILDQAQTPVTNALSSIKITIKGDPYWLGYDYDTVIANNSGVNGNGIQADFTAGDICFILYFRYPTTSNDDGSPNFKDNDVFNGVYRVTEIANRFQNGQFTQILTAIRLPNIAPSDSNILGQTNPTTNQAVGTPTLPSSVTGFAPR